MTEPGTSWRDRLFGGLKRTSDKLGENLTGLFNKAALDDQTLDEIEEALIMTDLGPAMAGRVRARLAEGRFNKELTEEYLREIIAEEIEKVLAPVARPLEIEAFPRPQVILVIGVNGSGKTTTIAKLAHNFLEQDYGVMLAAGDTFRAAAIGQLKVWAERLGVPIVAGKEGGDAAGIVFDAVKQATEKGVDVLIVDTAGRLQNKTELMEELAKVRRVLGRLHPAAPHDVVLVLDAPPTPITAMRGFSSSTCGGLISMLINTAPSASSSGSNNRHQMLTPENRVFHQLFSFFFDSVQ